MRTLMLTLIMASALYAQTPAIEPGVSQELARWRAARYSDVRYKLDLTLEKMSPVLKGTLQIRVNVRDAGNERRGDAPIILDWRKIKGHEDRSTISNASINGRVVSPGESNEHLIFRDGVVAGENVIKLDFTSPILPSGSAITRYIDKEDGSEYIYSLFVPSDASTAFPVFDQPDLKGRFTLSVTGPVDWNVVSNTAFGEIRKLPASRETLQTRSFDETKPISTYVFAFAAGPWQQVSAPSASLGRSPAEKAEMSLITGGNPSGSEGAEIRDAKSGGTLPTGRVSASISISIYVRRSQLAKFQPHAPEVFRLNREGVEFLEEYFDYKFPFPKYDLVLIPEFPFNGMEHAGATFLRESGIIFPSEPTANDHISRANLIFHEAAHQWFGDTVTMRWFDDLWLKEGFAEFMAYKTLERVMPQYNAWKAFYERNKPLAYQTDSTKGTTPIYQEIKNLKAAKSAYGNIVYRKAPSFLKQAEFYLGPDTFQTAVRAFLKRNEFKNAEWNDLVSEFQTSGGDEIKDWAQTWVKVRGLARIRFELRDAGPNVATLTPVQENVLGDDARWLMKMRALAILKDGTRKVVDAAFVKGGQFAPFAPSATDISSVMPNYGDYGYGIFLLDPKSREYVLKNIQNEEDAFLRSMMWGAMWDSVREQELDPRDYVELVIKNVSVEKDELTIQTILARASVAMTYYISEKDRGAFAPRLETMLIDNMQRAPKLGQRITYYRALLNVASTEKARGVLKEMLRQSQVRGSTTTTAPQAMPAKGGNPSGSEGAKGPETQPTSIPLKTKDRFDIVTRLLILNDPDAAKLLGDLERSETSDDAKRYAYAARAAFATKEAKEKYWNDFTRNKEISESWIEAAFLPFNSVRHADLTLPYLERALKELPNHKRNRKIFFVNGWLAAFIGGQRSEEALNIVNRFLADNPSLDRDLRLKILENVDIIERAVKIRSKYPVATPLIITSIRR